MMTNRQVAGLGQELGTLNPESPEWAQQAVQLGSRYPLAMKSPAGQFMLGTQAKAHAQWQQTQQATARAQTQFGNSVALEGLKQRNRLALATSKPGQQMVDLESFAGAIPQQNAMGGRTPLPSLDPVENKPVTDEQAPLFGQTGGLGDISADVAKDFGGKGKIPASQFYPAVRQERSFRQQSKMQEDRQAASEAAAAARDTARAKADETKAARAEAVQQRLILQGQINTIERDITQHRAALTKHLASKGDKDEEFYATKAELEAALQAAGAERTKLMEQINSIGKEASAEKKLDVKSAAELLKEAGGDKEKARALARERGFTF